MTGQTVTRRTARTYHGAIVWTDSRGSLVCHAWVGRPDLAAAALAKVARAGVADARLAPVTGDPWADAAAAQAQARDRAAAGVTPATVDGMAAHIKATQARDHAAWALEAAGHPVTPAAIDRAVASCPPLPTRRPVLPGETTPPPAALAGGPGPELPALRADAAAGRPVSLAALARALADDLATPGPTPDSLRARAAARSAESDRLAAAGDPERAVAAARHAAALTDWADQLAPRSTGSAWEGQPWDPGTPDARARVALQGERVATLWPIAQALRGEGVTLPPSWATDGPVMAGELPYAQALAALPLGAIAQAAAALAALPPVTAAQSRALALCRGQAV